MAIVVNDRLLAVLQKKIREHMNAQQNSLIDPGYEKQGDYQFHRGLAMGLALAERELLDLDASITVAEDQEAE